MKMTYRTLSGWPREHTPHSRRRHDPFTAGWADTVDLLHGELEKLGAREVVIELDMDPSQIRLDGLPRAGARTNGFPGVVVSFLSKHGPMSYASDSCTRWEQNVRAIALGLAALRAVDRYGITPAGEQYSGFAAIGSGPSSDVGVSRPAYDPRRVIADLAGVEQGDLSLRAWVHKAMFAAHPDHGGSTEQLAALRAAETALSGTAR